IIITGYPSIDTAINAIKQGATDYLIKPINLEEILIKVNRIVEENQIKKESFMLKHLTKFLELTYRLSIDSNLIRILSEVEHFIKELINYDGIFLYIDFKNEIGLEFKEQISNSFSFPPDECDKLKGIIRNAKQALFFSANEKTFPHLIRDHRKTHFGLVPLKSYSNHYGGIIIMKVLIPFTDLYKQILKMLSSHLSSIVENCLLNRTMHLNYLSTIQALAEAVDKKDQFTHHHSRNVMRLSLILAQLFALSDEEMDTLRYAALLHDIGKIGIPEDILNKKGKLTPEEYQLIQNHPVIGADIVQNIPSLRKLVPHILSHHERIDGKGYPYGLAGNQIPFLAKIIAVADTFEAMFSKRVYRPSIPLEFIREELLEVANFQLDEVVVQKMIYIIDNNMVPDLL
nr:HD domain-containing protein [Candidatus Delongbacteria bacterium]